LRANADYGSGALPIRSRPSPGSARVPGAADSGASIDRRKGNWS
jgi:hypothetical protein